MKSLIEKITENMSYHNVVQVRLTSSGSEYTIEGKGRVFSSADYDNPIYVKEIDGVVIDYKVYLGGSGSYNNVRFIDFSKSIVLQPQTNGQIVVVQLAD